MSISCLIQWKYLYLSVSYIMGDGKVQEKRITVRLNGIIADFVMKMAKERNTTMSAIVRAAIIAYRDEDYQLYKKIVAQIGMQKLLEEVNKHE